MSLIAQPTADPAGSSSSAFPRCLDTPAPRYTAYPTADRFVEAFGPEDLQYALRQRANGAVVGGCAPLAVHVSVPAARGSSRVGNYLHALGGEIARVASALGTARTVSRLNLGGPALLRLSRSELARLVDLLRRSFDFECALPMSAEVDTRSLVEGRLAHLRQLGCTELVVDIPPASGSASADPLATVIRLVASAHRLGFATAGVRVPLRASAQTREALRTVLGRLLSARPDRIALRSLPAPAPGADVPGPARLAQGEPQAMRGAVLNDAIEWLEAAGYVHVGLEEFALRTDALAIARAQGRLFLGIDGFDDHPCADLIALGAGALGQVGATYYQNLVDVADYEEAIARGRLPVGRGLALARDDLARRAVIHALVCQGRVDFESMRLAHLIDPMAHFAPELAEMSSLAGAGLVRLDDEAIELTAAGCRSANAVAAVFDRFRRAQVLRNQCATLL